MKLHIAKKHFTAMLAAAFTPREAEQLMRILLEDLFGFDLKQQIMQPDLCLDAMQQRKLKQAIGRLLQGEPVQYVAGMARFGELVLKVNPSVLIPRPETEEIVARIVADQTLANPMRIWDVGTGSGCIAIALAKHFPEAEVLAFDVSDAALDTARENALANKVNVSFVCDDVLHPSSDYFDEPVDLVVSNPPYVCLAERAGMERNVLDYEPESALFVPDSDPLCFYRQILRLSRRQLRPGGVVWFEINEAMGEAMLALCRSEGFAEASLFSDFAGKTRACKVW